MANRNERPMVSKGRQPPNLSVPGTCEPQFLDDLIAAIRLKSCLIGRGADVDDKTLDELAELQSRFSNEIKAGDETLGALNAAQRSSKGIAPPPEAPAQEAKA